MKTVETTLNCWEFHFFRGDGRPDENIPRMWICMKKALLKDHDTKGFRQGRQQLSTKDLLEGSKTDMATCANHSSHVDFYVYSKVSRIFYQHGDQIITDLCVRQASRHQTLGLRCPHCQVPMFVGNVDTSSSEPITPFHCEKVFVWWKNIIKLPSSTSTFGVASLHD